MGLDKSIQYGKEHRKPYRGVKAIDATCRNHGSCERCHGSRIYKNEKKETSCNSEIRRFSSEFL